MSSGQYERRDRLIQEKCHDVYKDQGKWPEATVCTECGALYANGRWLWVAGKVQSEHRVVCPACRRITDNYPAGYIEISGPFFETKRTEILSLIYHTEEQEKSEHPLERIISTEEEENKVLITTTGIHIARGIGEALHRAYKGEFNFQYAEGDEVIRVYWSR